MSKSEYYIVRNESALIDTSDNGRISIHGANAEVFLDFALGLSMDEIIPGNLRNTLMLREDGSLVATLWVVNLDDGYMLITEPTDREGVLEQLSNLNKEFDCTITDITTDSFDIAIVGPNAEPIVADSFTSDVYIIAFQNWMIFDDVHLIRYGSCGEYEIHIIGSLEHRSKIVEIFSKALDKGELKWVDRKVLIPLATEMRHLLRDPHIPDTINVFEAGIQWMVDLSKTNFCGKEMLMEQRNRQERQGVLLFSEEALSLTTERSLFLEDQNIGRIVCSYYSESLSGHIHFSYIDKEFAWPGIAFKMENGFVARSISSPAFLTRSVVNTIS